MEEARFGVLVNTLKIMDKESLRRATLRDSIKEIIGHFDSSFTTDQKNEVVKELKSYAAKKQDFEEMKRLEKRLDEERYRVMLDSFLHEGVGAF